MFLKWFFLKLIQFHTETLNCKFNKDLKSHYLNTSGIFWKPKFQSNGEETSLEQLNKNIDV